jgi:hypothetical protein
MVYLGFQTTYVVYQRSVSPLSQQSHLSGTIPSGVGANPQACEHEETRVSHDDLSSNGKHESL